MKRVNWLDEKGVLRCSLLRDTDSETNPRLGIPIEPPPIDTILEDAKSEIRTALIEAGLFTWDDVQRQQNSLELIVKRTVHRKLVMAYRQGVK